MSIASEIQRIQNNINSMYDSLEAMGVEVPANKNSNNLLQTVNNTVPRIPSNCVGLAIWLDGDYNTRNGLDRSKKYMENILWNKPLVDTVGNFEVVSQNTSNNSWNGNLLVCNGWFGLLPTIAHHSSISFELVYKVNSAWSGGTMNMYQALGGGGGFAPNIRGDANGGIQFYYSYYDDSNNLTGANYTANDEGIGVIKYVCFTISNESILRIISPGLNIDKNMTVNYAKTTIDQNVGLFHGQTDTIEDLTSDWGVANGHVEIGMMRLWTRALTTDEIHANYKDTKKRFGCI